MGFFSQVATEILELAEDGASPEEIAIKFAKFGITVDDVLETLAEFEAEYKEEK